MLELDTGNAGPDADSSAAVLTNITIPAYLRERLNGAMVYVPIGKSGVIVQIAGQTPNDPTWTWGIPYAQANGESDPVSSRIISSPENTSR